MTDTRSNGYENLRLLSNFDAKAKHYPASGEYFQSMSKLIDRVKADAEAVGIVTLPPEEITEMLGEWEQGGAKNAATE